MSVYKKTSLGFTANGVQLPDPSSYSYTVSDLDASGERDTTGLLHRDRVAVKHNVSVKWNALDWNTVNTILNTVSAESFSFTFPCPEANGSYTGTYYVGDRSVENITMFSSAWGDYVGGLSINFIEF